MSPFPKPPAGALASLRHAAEAAMARRAVASLGPETLLLALLLRLLAGLERLLHALLPPAPGVAAEGQPFQIELSDTAWHQWAALQRVRAGLPPCAGAPQADAVALRLMPDWWLPCTAGFGMRPLCARLPSLRTTGPARAPPPCLGTVNCIKRWHLRMPNLFRYRNINVTAYPSRHFTLC